MHHGGVAAVTARRGEEEPAAAGHAWPAAGVYQPVAAALAPAAKAPAQPILVGSSSSRHCREDRHDVEAQHQEDARAARHHAWRGHPTHSVMVSWRSPMPFIA
jgi:hypothetical protein